MQEQLKNEPNKWLLQELKQRSFIIRDEMAETELAEKLAAARESVASAASSLEKQREEQSVQVQHVVEAHEATRRDALALRERMLAGRKRLRRIVQRGVGQPIF